MMRVAIIALILSIAALGLGSFATFTALDNDGSPETAPAATESTWSATECEAARAELIPRRNTIAGACRYQHDCAPYNDLLQAINDNCP